MMVNSEKWWLMIGGPWTTLDVGGSQEGMAHAVEWQRESGYEL